MTLSQNIDCARCHQRILLHLAEDRFFCLPQDIWKCRQNIDSQIARTLGLIRRQGACVSDICLTPTEAITSWSEKVR